MVSCQPGQRAWEGTPHPATLMGVPGPHAPQTSGRQDERRCCLSWDGPSAEREPCGVSRSPLSCHREDLTRFSLGRGPKPERAREPSGLPRPMPTPLSGPLRLPDARHRHTHLPGSATPRSLENGAETRLVFLTAASSQSRGKDLNGRPTVAGGCPHSSLALVCPAPAESWRFQHCDSACDSRPLTPADGLCRSHLHAVWASDEHYLTEGQGQW